MSSDTNSIAQAPSVGTRETLLYEQALEAVYGRPYASLLGDVVANDSGDAADLLRLGKRLFMDFVRLARGEISGIRVPTHLPRREELAAPAV